MQIACMYVLLALLGALLPVHISHKRGLSIGDSQWKPTCLSMDMSMALRQHIHWR